MDFTSILSDDDKREDRCDKDINDDYESIYYLHTNCEGIWISNKQIFISYVNFNLDHFSIF